MRHYVPLTVRPLPKRASFRQPAAVPAAPLSLDDPALEVMTDLERVAAVTIDPEASIEHAMRVMVRRNVRLLLVVNVDNEIVGLITSTDLLGEKPFLHLQEHGGRRADVQVRDIMTPHERLEALPMRDVRAARVGHVLETLKASRRQHALVVESDAEGHPMVRGIFSASQLSRQLGQTVQTGMVAYTFAEIEAALNGP
jgi:CBS-domain-containing membrane protein